MKQQFLSLILVAVGFIGMTVYDYFTDKHFPKPIKSIFEAGDGLHVLYKDNNTVEDILIELLDEQDTYSIDINGKVYTIKMFRHCTIGTCDVVDIAVDGDLFEVSSFIR